MKGEAWIGPVLDRLRAAHLDRSLRVLPRGGGKITLDGRQYLNFSSNDYLDLANDRRIVARAAETMDRCGAGCGASRLVTGTLQCHAELEAALAAWLARPGVLVFGSGYLTNAGVLSTLLGRDDVVLADRLVHATILDGIVLSRAKLQRFHHNDVDHLAGLLAQGAAARRPGSRLLVVTESVFSMDGDLAPLAAIAEAAGRYEAMLMVDEAHALGVFGPQGAGLVAQHDLQQSVNVVTGTLSKALASYGGLAACSAELRTLLVQCARPFIYSTALPPASIGAALAALEIAGSEPGLGATLLARSALLRGELRAAGLDVLGSQSQIIPLVVGDSARALRLAERLKAAGILAVAIREPTVPAGTARLRLSVTLAHSEEDLRRAAAAIIAAARAEDLGKIG